MVARYKQTALTLIAVALATLGLAFISNLVPIIAVGLFLFVAYAAWRGGDGSLAYGVATMVGIGASMFVIGNGFKSDAWYGFGVAAGLAVVGYLRSRISRTWWQLLPARRTHLPTRSNEPIQPMTLRCSKRDHAA
jgi:hypothetical protein